MQNGDTGLRPKPFNTYGGKKKCAKPRNDNRRSEVDHLSGVQATKASLTPDAELTHWNKKESKIMKNNGNIQNTLTRIKTFSLPGRIISYALLPVAAVLGFTVGILRIPFTLCDIRRAK